MIRKMIKIVEEKCNGCGACAVACHEGAIVMIDGKAKLLRDDYCDGLGDCLPVCPTGAIAFESREAAAYDEAAVLERKKMLGGGCPGSKMRALHPADVPDERNKKIQSCLRQWPVQIKLVPVLADYFDGADVLIAADCAAYAYGNFHQEFINGRVTLIGCPKLDMVDYADKLTEIFRQKDIKSVTVARMEVPCCGGIESAVERALGSCGKVIPCRVVTIGIDGQI